VPYLVNGNQFITYDDLSSVKEKLIFLKTKGLGGALVMSIDTDDFHNNCNDGTNPMTSLIMKELNQI
jgi:chitinase